MIGLLSIIPYGKAIAVAIVVALFGLYSYSLYNKGYNSAVVVWSAKYNARENELIRQSMAEAARQQAANQAAKKAEAERIAKLEADNTALENLIKELSDEADKDPAADNVCLPDASRLRINRVR